jgi:prolipoprotein diacylglyceryl transferase
VNPAALTPLAEIPSPTQSVWFLGSVPIRAYALCIVLGIVTACAVTEIRMRRRGAPPWAVLDIAVWAVPFGIVGARIYHVITSPDHYFGRGGDPLDAFKIWHGGLGIWGAVAGGALGAWIAARRMGIPLSFVADALAPGLPLAQAIGRWGNWFNNELFGLQTSLPWGLKVYDWDNDNGRAVLDPSDNPIARPGLYHPTFLYESLWDIGVALLVWLADRKYKFGGGRAFALYVMAYTVGRFWIENLRDDEAHLFLGMRLNSWTSIVVFIGALIYFVRVRAPQVRLVTSEDGRITVVPVGAVPGDASSLATPTPVPADDESPPDNDEKNEAEQPDAPPGDPTAAVPVKAPPPDPAEPEGTAPESTAPESTAEEAEPAPEAAGGSDAPKKGDGDGSDKDAPGSDATPASAGDARPSGQ